MREFSSQFLDNQPEIECTLPVLYMVLMLPWQAFFNTLLLVHELEINYACSFL